MENNINNINSSQNNQDNKENNINQENNNQISKIDYNQMFRSRLEIINKDILKIKSKSKLIQN
jgi:hypothetical protein